MSTPNPTEVEVNGRQIILEMMTHAARHRTLQELALLLLQEYSADMKEAGLGEKYGSVALDHWDITWVADETYGEPYNCLTFSWEESYNDGGRDSGTITVPFGWITGRSAWIEQEKVRQAEADAARQASVDNARRRDRETRIANLQAEIDSLRALQ